MRKIFYSFGLAFLAIAIADLALIIAKIYQGNQLDVFSASFIALLALFMALNFFSFGRHCKKQEQKRVAFINETYQKLMDIYEDINSPEGRKDKLSVRLFVTGVYDFGCYVWDIVTDETYPKNIRDDADQKLNELLKRVAEIV